MNEAREAVLIAELEVGELVQMSISSTFTNTEEAYFPTFDDLQGDLPKLSNLNPDGQKNKELRYLSEDQKWIHPSFRFKEGDEISLSANLEQVGMQNIYATTRAPIAGAITQKSNSLSINDNGDYEFMITLARLNHEEDYYHVLPYLASSSTAESKDFIDIEASSNGNSSLLKPVHMDGILIDIDITDSELEFLITIPASEIASFNPSHIYLKLKTVTKDYYDYHQSLTFQLESQQGPFDAPVPTVSNIERGQGLFTAYTTSMDSIRVN